MGRAPRADACRNRDRLLECASAAFSRDGIDASLERIAKDAGVGIGTLYRNFANRDCLMEAVYRHNVDALEVDAEKIAANNTPGAALDEFMQRFVAYVATKKGLAMHLKTVLGSESELFVDSQQRLHAIVHRMVDAAIASGEVRPDTDADDLTRALAGVCMTSDMSVSQEQPLRIAKLLMDGLRYGAPASTASAG
ncbi:MAG TPA: TetR/AcrR family transcriptional regulator [Mycobacteriales bacterium]|nr:TetR/AcrR family transcriptional regulator [Mycobacteriales bacterium]